MSNYPTSLDDQSSLYNPADSFSTKPLITTTAALVLVGDTTIQLAASVASLGGPAAYGIVSIDDEMIIYTGSSGVNLTGCIRGAFGTTAIGHANGATLKWRYVSAFDKALQAAVLALEGTLGITGAFKFLFTNADSAIVWDSTNHRLGVGSSAAPQASIHITDGDNIFTDRYAESTGLIGRRANGTRSAPTKVTVGQRIAYFLASAWYQDGTPAFGNNAGVTIWAEEDITSTARGSSVSLETTAVGSTTRRKVVTAKADGSMECIGQIESKATGFKFPDASVQTKAINDSGDVIGLFSGTPDGTKFLRDDGSLAAASGGSSVEILASSSASSTLSGSSWVDVVSYTLPAGVSAVQITAVVAFTGVTTNGKSCYAGLQLDGTTYQPALDGYGITNYANGAAAGCTITLHYCTNLVSSSGVVINIRVKSEAGVSGDVHADLMVVKLS